jgi:transposase
MSGLGRGQAHLRPPIPEAKRRRIEELYRAGTSINDIGKKLGIGYGTWKYIRALEQG